MTLTEWLVQMIEIYKSLDVLLAGLLNTWHDCLTDWFTIWQLMSDLDQNTLEVFSDLFTG